MSADVHSHLISLKWQPEFWVAKASGLGWKVKVGGEGQEGSEWVVGEG